MLGNRKIELIYIKFFWVFILIFTLDIVVIDILRYEASRIQLLPSFSKYLYLAFVIILNYVKLKFVKGGSLKQEKIHFIFRALEIPTILFGMVFLGVGPLGYILVIFPALITGYTLGHGKSYLILGYSFITNIFIEAIYIYLSKIKGLGILDIYIFNKSLILIFSYLVFIFLVEMSERLYKEHSENKLKSQELIEELEDKYDQLIITQKDVVTNYEKLKSTNSKLEEINLKLSSSLAEFYTLQQITQAISSILDIRELLRHVNDIIIGVMGVSNSTILLYDDKRNRLKISATSVKDQEELVTISDNINCSILLQILKDNKNVIENFVDSDEYLFTKGRNVNSLVCVPLTTKNKKFGIVIIEHTYKNAFDEENVRLLEIIRQQVCIALENAELYQKMHELAITDSLTGVYNRLFFHEKVREEFESAEKNNYKLSLAIFDIDHFKKFNDTFGHAFGDKVLKHIANLVKYSLRSSDVIARFGGEEFVILFPRTDITEAYEKVEFLRKKIECSRIKDDSIDVSITVSFGMAGYPSCGDSDSDVLKAADIALYEAKNSGRNCVKIAKECEF